LRKWWVGQGVNLLGKNTYYKKAELRFRCTGCGKCCYGDPKTHYIAATDRELVSIQRFLKLSRQDFFAAYIEALPWGGHGIQLQADGACPFLADGKCQIYEFRPAQCKSYPFWPEVVGLKNDWLSEAKRCEGINRGEIIPLAQIERELKQCGD